MYFPSTSLSTTILLTSLASSSSAAQWKMFEKAVVKPSASTPFTLVAAHSDSPIHRQPINAQQNAFYIGNVTESYCPATSGIQCPIGNVTALQTYSTGRCSMDVEVPAGQSVYVNNDGALKYTVAHSNVIPQGAKVKSFALFRGPQYNFFTFSGVGKASGFLACPVNETVYQVFANLPSLADENVPEKNVSACIGFDAWASNYNGYSAWQYE